MNTKPLIIITRPAEEAALYAAELQAQGFQTFVEPMLDIVSRDFVAPDLTHIQAILATSAQAVRFYAAQVTDRKTPLYCVGVHTARTARQAGFTKVISAQGTGDNLVALVKEQLDPKEGTLLHIRGVHVARPLDELLGAAGFKVENLVVYEAQKRQGFSAEFQKLLDERTPMGVTFFSKRTAETFIELMDRQTGLEALSDIKTLCISPPVLEYVQGYGFGQSEVAQTPDRVGMYALLKTI